MRPLLALLIGLLFGCTLTTRIPPMATPLPTVTPVPTLADPAVWQALAPGLDVRSYQPPDNPMGQLRVVRIDPNRYEFRAHYRPDAPLYLAGWRDELPGAVAFINANFFSPDNTILGLLVADGAVFGQSYRDRGGTFLVQNGQPRIRSNIAEPYAGEPIEQAVQAFPMLVLNGQATFFQRDRIARRTIVAQDRQGRILFMVTPLVGLPLADLSAWLTTTDMNIIHALNLDGGGSTLLFAAAPDGRSERLTSFDPVPAVLAVYPR